LLTILQWGGHFAAGELLHGRKQKGLESKEVTTPASKLQKKFWIHQWALAEPIHTK